MQLSTTRHSRLPSNSFLFFNAIIPDNDATQPLLSLVFFYNTFSCTGTSAFFGISVFSLPLLRPGYFFLRGVSTSQKEQQGEERKGHSICQQ